MARTARVRNKVKAVTLTPRQVRRVQYEADRCEINFSEMLRRIVDWFFDDIDDLGDDE